MDHNYTEKKEREREREQVNQGRNATENAQLSNYNITPGVIQEIRSPQPHDPGDLTNTMIRSDLIPQISKNFYNYS